MSTVHGLDPVEVRALAAMFHGASDRFHGVSNEVTNDVTASWWHGRDADDFRRSWSRRRVTLDEAAGALAEMREHLVRQAHEQEAASSTSAGPAAGAPRAGFFGLDWPSAEDVTGFVDDVQQHIGDGLDAAMEQDWLAGPIATLLGFEYVPGQDFYTTNETSIQSHLGFHDVYDKLHTLGGMDLDAEVVEFAVDGTEYRLELWKGGYGFGTAFGGEIGLYTQRPDETGLRWLFEQIPGYSSSAQGADQIPMTQTIYNTETGEVYFTNDGQGAADGDHYWNLAIRTEAGVSREDIGQMGTLHVADPDVRAQMADAMRQQGLDPVVDDAAGTVSYTWEG